MADEAPPTHVWISPTLANKSVERSSGDSLYLHEVIVLERHREEVMCILDILEIAYREMCRQPDTAKSALGIVSLTLQTYGRKG